MHRYQSDGKQSVILCPHNFESTQNPHNKRYTSLTFVFNTVSLKCTSFMWTQSVGMKHFKKMRIKKIKNQSESLVNRLV